MASGNHPGWPLLYSPPRAIFKVKSAGSEPHLVKFVLAAAFQYLSSTGVPERDTVTDMQSHMCQVEGISLFPGPVGYAGLLLCGLTPQGLSVNIFSLWSTTTPGLPLKSCYIVSQPSAWTVICFFCPRYKTIGVSPYKSIYLLHWSEAVYSLSKILTVKTNSCPGQQTRGVVKGDLAFTRKALETQAHCWWSLRHILMCWCTAIAKSLKWDSYNAITVTSSPICLVAAGRASSALQSFAAGTPSQLSSSP